MYRKFHLFVLAVLPCLLVLYFSQPSSAVCVRNPFTGREVCHQDLDPTRVIPGSAEVAEQAWGEAGSVAYQAAARIMRERNGSGQGLDETQKRFLRQRYSGLVDQVRVAYGSSMMSEWCAAGKCVNLGGVDSAAQTYCDRIYAGDPYKPNDADQLVLLAHEMRHSQQCRERGGEGSFGFHYFREYKRAGQNYATNSMEVDAVNTAKDFARNVICTQVGCPPSSGEFYTAYPSRENDWGLRLPVSLASPVTGVPISANFGNTLFYDRSNGLCAFTASNGSVIQRLTTCRRTWHSIVYTANMLLFYDRDAGQIETYRVGNQGLGERLHTYALNSMRKTWAQITSPSEGIIVFRDDNGQVETYRLNNIGMLQGL